MWLRKTGSGVQIMAFPLLFVCVMGFVNGSLGRDDLASADTEEETQSTESVDEFVEEKKDPWMEEALKDVAYYLRSHKFNDFDRRFHRKEDNTTHAFFSAFPNPPLRNLHWEVHRSCILSLADCIRYVHKVARQANLRREDDAAVIVVDQGWKIGSAEKKGPIDEAQKECRELFEKDHKRGKPFDGPLERFQWRTSASYFMCWYTMLKEPALETIGDRCDNYASCLDPKLGATNMDFRAVSKEGLEEPFACALYSFCPDPCCPGKHYASEQDCWSDPLNPCRMANGEIDAKDPRNSCEFRMEENTDLTNMVNNRWNVSCNCSSSPEYYWRQTAPEGTTLPNFKGYGQGYAPVVLKREGAYEWQSRFGMCVDVNECSIGTDVCDRNKESCHNLPGGYSCSCRFGYVPSSPYPPEMFLEKGKLDLECMRDKRLKAANDIVAAIRGIKESDVNSHPGNGAMESGDTKREFISKEKENAEVGADFETAIGLAGVGKFNYLLMLVCGSVFANAAIGIASIAFVLPSAQCDFRLSSEDKGRLSASPNIGMLVGSCIWGLMADAKGRKWMMVSGLLMDAICGFASSLTQSYWPFVIFRFFNGFGITAASTLVFAYLGEFLPSSKRDRMLCWLELFWSFGVVILPGVAWLVIPQTWSYVSAGGGFTFNSWRLFVALCGIPSILNACLLCVLPETPKFLMSKNKLDEAYVVFQKIHRYNRGTKHEYGVKVLQGTEEVIRPSKNGHVDNLGMTEVSLKDGNDKEEEVVVQKRSGIFRALSNIGSQTKALFTPPHLRSTLITFTVQVGLMSSYYTLILWFPDLFDRFERFQALYPNRTASICEVTAAIAEEGGIDSLPCGSDGEPIVPEKVFINALYVGIACIPSSIWLALCVDRLGKKFILVVSLITAGACTLGFNFVWTSTQNLILSCIFEAITGMTISALLCVVVELFPTNLRAFALALSLTIGRIGAITGNVAFGWLIDFNCVVPIVIGGVALIGSGLLCLAIPKVNQDLPM